MAQRAKHIDVLAKNRQGEVVLIKMRWGLIPHTYAGDPADWSASTFHARIETVADLDSFKSAWARKRRVIIPLERFFEQTGSMPDLLGQGAKKSKIAISRADGEPLGVAGIYDHAQTLAGPVLSFAMLTREAGPRMATIHDREPAVIEPQQFQAWLDGSDELDLSKPWADDAFSVAPAP